MKLDLIIYLVFVFGGSFVASFSWQSCGDNGNPIKILSLDMNLNGTQTLYVTGRGKVGLNITDPIQAKVLMMKKFFWGWTEVPCVDQVGSCTYEDICLLTPYSDKPCPEEFAKNGIPCRCPILQGQYAVKKLPISLSILPHWIEQGRYKIKVNLTRNSTELLCLILYFTL